MTNFEKSAIIINGKILPLPIYGNIKTIEIKTEEYADRDASRFNLHSECENICEKNKKKMANLKELTYYLVQLFYQTGKKYSCTQTKIGKMLSILAFRYAKNDLSLFDAPIYKYPPRCGTLIKELTFIPKDVYIRDLDSPNPDKLSPIDDTFDCTVEIPSPYNEVENLSSEVKHDVRDLFLNFGAYPADVLGKLLNPIVDRLVIAQNDKIDLSLITTLDKSNIAVSEDGNAIVDYIYRQ